MWLNPQFPADLVTSTEESFIFGAVFLVKFSIVYFNDILEILSLIL